MDQPELIGIRAYKPLPRWRLGLSLVLLLGAAAFNGFLITKAPVMIPWMGGFIFLHWLVPVLIGLGGAAWGLRGWHQDDLRPRSFWGVAGLAFLMFLGMFLWWKLRQTKLNIDGHYDSHIEYVSLSNPPAGWPDPAHPETFDLGEGLRLTMSTAIWTDGLHRSLPATHPAKPAPYPEAGDPHPLSAQGQKNLQVLMKACALVRFFQPTDAASNLRDWGRLISQGVRQVEDAPTPEDLAQRLNGLLTPYAPQARVLLPGEAVPVYERPQGAKLLGRWCHLGVSPGFLDSPFTGPTKDRSIRLAGVGMAWGTLKHFYPYWDVTPENWDEALAPALAEAAVAKGNYDYVETLLHLLSHARDGHAWAFDLSAPNLGRPEVDLEMVDGHPIVAKRWGEAQNLPLGSEILSVDGVPAAALMAKLRPKMIASTQGFTDARVASWILIAEPNQSLKVEVGDLAGRRSEHLLITRLHPGSTQPLPQPIREVKPGILMVDLERIEDGAFDDALPKLTTARGIIFDLRGYPPGRNFLAHFRPGTFTGIRMARPLSRRPDGLGRSYAETLDKTLSKAPFYQGKAVVLAGPLTGSFGETCLEIVAANHLAPIVGAPSAGTEGDFLPFWLPGNVSLRFTGMKVLKADGSQFQGIGIQPTIPVKHTREALAAGRDEDVERALAYIETGK